MIKAKGREKIAKVLESWDKRKQVLWSTCSSCITSTTNYQTV